MAEFQSTRPIRGATYSQLDNAVRGIQFQSTRPIRGATDVIPDDWYQYNHFNPRAPYGARLQVGICLLNTMTISIHAPHTGRDLMWKMI